MARSVKSFFMVLIAAVLIAAVAPPCEAAIGCGSVVSYMNPCLLYVTGKGSLGGCCNDVKGLYSAAKSTPDRQSVCSCLKSLAGSYSNVDAVKAANLPGRCGVSIP